MIFAILLLGVAGTMPAAPKPSTVSLVMLSIDGLRPDYVLEADRYNLRIPNLRRLLREGAYATGVAGVLPTVTYPSHTTLVTGATPAHHGIFANAPFDPLGKNYDGWYWYAEDIKVPTLWDVAARAGRTTGSVEWPATAGAALDWNLPQYWRAKNAEDPKLYRLLATPGLLAELEPLAGTYPPSHEWAVEFDERRIEFARLLLDRKRPQILFAYVAGLDQEEHQTGPHSAGTFAVLERVDGLVGKLRAAAEKNGPTVFAVVSDHGFNRTDRELHLNEALREEGLISLDGRGRVTAWRAAAWNGGGSAAIMIKDPKDAEAHTTVERLLARLRESGSCVDRVLSGPEAEAAGGFPGSAFVVGLASNCRLGGSLEAPALRPGPVRGTHGMLPDDRNMDASFFIVGPSVPAGHALGRIDMRDVAPTIAGRVGLILPAAEGRDVLK